MALARRTISQLLARRFFSSCENPHPTFAIDRACNVSAKLSDRPADKDYSQKYQRRRKAISACNGTLVGDIHENLANNIPSTQTPTSIF